MPRFPHVTWTVVLAAGLLAHPAAAADTAALLTERAEKVRSATRAMAADRPAEAVTGFRRAADTERELFGPPLDVDSPTWTQLAWALVAAAGPTVAFNLVSRMDGEDQEANR